MFACGILQLESLESTGHSSDVISMCVRYMWEVRASSSRGRLCTRRRFTLATGRQRRPFSFAQRLWFLLRLTRAINEKGETCFFSVHSFSRVRATRVGPMRTCRIDALSHICFFPSCFRARVATRSLWRTDRLIMLKEWERKREKHRERVYRGCVCVARTTRATDVACTRACVCSRRCTQEKEKDNEGKR